jgi:hypothetical protein
VIRAIRLRLSLHFERRLLNPRKPMVRNSGDLDPRLVFSKDAERSADGDRSSTIRAC